MNNIEIIAQKGEFTKKEMVALATGTPTSMKDVDTDTMIHVSRYLVYKEYKEDGTEILLTAIYPDEYEGQGPIVTSSKTLSDTLRTIDAMLGEESFDIKKVTGTSKAGRTFITCELV